MNEGVGAPKRQASTLSVQEPSYCVASLRRGKQGHQLSQKAGEGDRSDWTSHCGERLPGEMGVGPREVRM